MATGKKAKDIFSRTTSVPKVDKAVTPRTTGRPPAAEPYQKVTVCLFDRQVLFLDKVALSIREKTGRHVRRADLVRAIVEKVAPDLDPDGKSFEKNVRTLFSEG